MTATTPRAEVQDIQAIDNGPVQPLLAYIARLFDIDAEALTTNNNRGRYVSQNICDAKHLARKVLFEDLPLPRRKQWSVYEVAALLNCKHSSISTSCKAAGNLIETDKLFRSRYQRVLKKLEINELIVPEKPVLSKTA
jgi:hypothetical protein